MSLMHWPFIRSRKLIVKECNNRSDYVCGLYYVNLVTDIYIHLVWHKKHLVRFQSLKFAQYFRYWERPQSDSPFHNRAGILKVLQPWYFSHFINTRLRSLPITQSNLDRSQSPVLCTWELMPKQWDIIANVKDESSSLEAVLGRFFH